MKKILEGTVTLAGVEILFDYAEYKWHSKKNDGIPYQPVDFGDVDYICDAYIANIATFLLGDLAIPDKFFPDVNNIKEHTDRNLERHGWTEVKDRHDIKFTWYVAWLLEHNMTPWCNYTIYEKREKRDELTVFRNKLHDTLKNHPYFELLNNMWLEKTGHELNWFRLPHNALIGDMIKTTMEKATDVQGKGLKSITDGWIYNLEGADYQLRWANSRKNRQLVERKFE